MKVFSKSQLSWALSLHRAAKKRSLAAAKPKAKKPETSAKEKSEYQQSLFAAVCNEKAADVK